MTELKPKGWKARAGLGASLLLHVAFVTVAILSLPRWRSPPEPRDLEVTLVPLQLPPLPRQPRPRAPRPAALAAGRPPAATPTPPLAIPTPAPSPPASGEDPDGRARVTALLRGSVGCSEGDLVRLTRQELDRCAKWRQAQAKPGLEILAPIEANKRAWFDATIAARNAPDHGPSVVCFGKPAHGVKLGPLPCYVEPPKGPFSEDVDVPPAPER